MYIIGKNMEGDVVHSYEMEETFISPRQNAMLQSLNRHSTEVKYYFSEDESGLIPIDVAVRGYCG